MPFLEWSSGSLLVSPAPSIVPLPISSPMIPLTVPSPVASPATAETEGFLTKLGARVEMQGGLIRDHMVRLGELSPALFKRYDRDIRELFTRSGAVRDEIFSQRYRFRSLKHEQERVAGELGVAITITEERCARLDLAEIVDSMRRGHDLCPKRVRDEVPMAPSMAVKPSTMEDNEKEFVEVHWQPKKSVDSKGGSNTTSPSGTTKESDKGVKVSSSSGANQNMTTPLSNSFDVLNTAEKEDVQIPKVSDHAGTSSLNLHVNKDQEESLWSLFNKGKENAKSKSSELKDESDDDEVYMPHGGGFTDGMEDDLECYDGYGTHVYDLTPQEQAFCDQYDIHLNSHGRK
ncbi:hypothetical protein Tco_0735185 [Tanacetum coccineum]